MDAYGTPTWEVEARKHLEKLPDEMKEVERVRTAHLADAQQCTRILEAMREEQRRLRRVLGVAADGNGEEGEADARDAR
jgi:glycerol kinase